MDTVALQRYRVTVALPRPAGDGALVPPGAQVLAEAAAAAAGAEDLMTAWTAAKTLLSMTVGSQCRSGALSADGRSRGRLAARTTRPWRPTRYGTQVASQAGRCGRRENAVSQGI
jgi:hypothetical protein